MYPQKVLQGVPNLKRAVKLRIFNLLVMPQAKPQHISNILLCHASGSSFVSQSFSHTYTPVCYAEQ